MRRLTASSSTMRTWCAAAIALSFVGSGHAFPLGEGTFLDLSVARGRRISVREGAEAFHISAPAPPWRHERQEPCSAFRLPLGLASAAPRADARKRGPRVTGARGKVTRGEAPSDLAGPWVSN